MTNDEKISKLEILLYEQIAWYKHYKPLEGKGDSYGDDYVDTSYIYDLARDEFDDFTGFDTLLAILSDLLD